MPRTSRIDTPGALQHIMARGMEKRRIFNGDLDRDDFLDRLGSVLENTHTTCFAWALLPNHFHLVLKTGGTPISTVMSRLLTGYAVKFNKRHSRVGHLFQNRFKSILCQEDAYLLELVRYVHLNPFRAGLVDDLGDLERYSYSGHSTLMGNSMKKWQDTGTILSLFGDKESPARMAYRIFVNQGAALGKRPELTGGGLVRSAGGWAQIKALRKRNDFMSSDERILGDGDFVEQVLAAADEALERKAALVSQGMTVDGVAERVAECLGVRESDVWSTGRQRRLVKARSLLCFWAVNELGTGMAALARRLNISVPAVSKSIVRGRKLAETKGLSLLKNE